MSSYIVEDSVVNTIVAGLNENNVIYHGWFETMDSLTPVQQGQAILDMNYFAVNERYKDNSKAHTYKHVSQMPPTKAKMLDALEELLDQCGHRETRKTDTYKEIYSLAGLLARDILRDARYAASK